MKFSKVLFVVTVFFHLLTSCCFKRSCCDLGRPPVLCHKSKLVIDYNECFENFYFEEPFTQKKPLDQEMFDPFQPLNFDYQFAKGDVVEVSLFDEEETTVQNALIAPDGKLYYTFLEGIEAVGRKPKEVAKDLENALKGLFLNPQVVIVPKLIHDLHYRILGRVKTPGIFALDGPITLRDAVAEAGGLLAFTTKDEDYLRRYLTPYYDLKNSFIVRDQQKLDVDFQKLLLKGDSDQNILVHPGDYIYIAGKERKEVFVLGSLNAPQRVPFVPGMTLLSVIATAGGWPTPNPYSPNLGRIVVIRGDLQCPRVALISIDKILCGQALDLRLEPGDIVYATYKHFRFARSMVLLAIESFLAAFMSGAAEHYSLVHWFDAFPVEEEVVE